MPHNQHKNSSTLKTIGIDISDGSIEIARITADHKGNIRLHEHARIRLDDDVIVHGIIKNEELLAETMKHLFSQVRLIPEEQHVIIALPDLQVIVKTISLEHAVVPPMHQLDAIAESFLRESHLDVPNPIVRWIYNQRSKQISELIVYITGQSYINQWKRFFKSIGTNLFIVEMESLAIGRSLINKKSSQHPICILDYGFRSTNLSIFKRNKLTFSHAIESGSRDITGIIANTMNVSLTHAEKLKIEKGLLDVDQHYTEKIRRTIIHDIRTLKLAELAKQYGFTEVYLAGGGANLNGLEILIKRETNLSAAIRPLAITNDNSNAEIHRFSLPTHEQTLYAGAIGLALRGVTRQPLIHGINFVRT